MRNRSIHSVGTMNCGYGFLLRLFPETNVPVLTGGDVSVQSEILCTIDSTLVSTKYKMCFVVNIP